MSRLCKPCRAGAALLSLSASPLFAASITGLDLQFIDDSNPARAENDRDIEATQSFRGRLSANLLALDPVETDFSSRGLSFNAAASYEHNADIDELGESRYRLSLDWFGENRRLSGSPFYRLSLGASYVDAETDLRDGPLVDFAASVNVQPTDFFDTTVGLLGEIRDADTEVFDSVKTQLFATANFSPFVRMVLRAGLRYVTGEEISTATPTLAIVDAAEVIEPDPAFGGVEANRFAYLLDADSAIAEIGAGYELSAMLEANLLYRFINTEADNDISYERSMIELTLSLEL